MDVVPWMKKTDRINSWALGLYRSPHLDPPHDIKKRTSFSRGIFM